MISPAASSSPHDPELKAAGQLASPTWELELFLSGAFVFAMFQLPEVVERLFVRLEPHATPSTSLVIFTGALYAKAIAFTLIVTFLVHLVARAHWVALLGLHSVFPQGIRWDEMKIGPIGRDVYQKQIPDLGRVIARLDNFCSIVFSAGLLVVLVFAYSTVLAGALAGLSYLLARGFSGGRDMRNYFYALAAVFVAIPLIGTLLDKKLGARMAPGSTGYRLVRGMLRIAFVLNVMRVTGPMMWTLATNVGRKRALVLLYIALGVLIMVAAGDRLFQADRLSMNSYDFFGASRAHGVQAQFYENQRVEGKAYSRIPFIQSDIVREPYVKLFIPYSPRRHNAAIPRACPGVKPLQARGLQIGVDPYLADSLAIPVISCMAGLHGATLDGVPVPPEMFAFYEHPRSGLKGIIAYLPVDSLPRGRHVITVLPAPPESLPTDSAALAEAAWTRPLVIPFWR